MERDLKGGGGSRFKKRGGDNTQKKPDILAAVNVNNHHVRAFGYGMRDLEGYVEVARATCSRCTLLLRCCLRCISDATI